MNNKGINVLSLFDGMSCGQIALERAGIKVNNYFASEIDTATIRVTKNNYPKTRHIGDVTKVNYFNGNLIYENKILNVGKIDLLIGGSPCQNFSFSGKKNGMSTKCDIEILNLERYLSLKKEGFKFEGQSFLFWEYVRLLKEIKKFNPDFKFLLENVKMSKKWSKIIDNELSCDFQEINSLLVSGQNRPRFYWTNISQIKKPENKGIVLMDILDKNTDESLFVKNTAYFNSDAKILKGRKIDILQKNYKNDNIKLEKCKLVSEIKNDTPSKLSRQGDRIYSILGKSPCLTTSGVIMIDNGSEDLNQWRRLSVNEKEKLQTVEVGYTKGESDARRSYMLGNGWTVDVIVEFFKHLKNE